LLELGFITLADFFCFMALYVAMLILLCLISVLVLISWFCF